MDKNELLEAMFTATASELLQRIKSGEASSADLSCARQMLKDNSITAHAAAESPLVDLIASLPSFEDEDDHV